jgi:hypothetical protein
VAYFSTGIMGIFVPVLTNWDRAELARLLAGAASTPPPVRNIFFAGLRCMFENQIGGPHLCLCRRSSSRLNRNTREPMRLTIFWGIWPVAIRPRTDEDVRPMYFAASGIGIGALSEWLPGTQPSSLREYGRLQWLR